MINEVRNTVLSILNKNNYGYLSPSDFNLFAKNAQLELYEEYFSSYNKTVNAENSRLMVAGQGSGTDYADIKQSIAEAMEVFVVEKFLVPIYNDGLHSINSSFYAPSLTTTGDEAYLINNITCYTNRRTRGISNGVNYSALEDDPATFLSDGIVPGDIVLNVDSKEWANVVQVYSDTSILLTADIFPLDFQEYAIFSNTDYSVAEKISNGKIRMLNMSSLTTPNLTFPAYVWNGLNLTLYPTSIWGYGSVFANYFRYPKIPKWTYSTLSNGEPAFNQSQPDYQDFELPQEDQYKLIMKILQYAGVTIRETDVVQFGIAQEQHEQPTFSQQQ